MAERFIFGKLPASRGNWDAQATYYKYNIVTQGSCSFMCIWNGDPFSGNVYEPSVRVINGQYIVCIGGIPQTIASRYWQLLSYGVDEATYQQDYITRINNLRTDLIGTDQDDGYDLTIKGQHNYIYQVDAAYRQADTALRTEIVGTAQDPKTTLTLNGLKAYANDLVTYSDSKVSDVEFDQETGVLSAVFTTFN